MIEKTITIADTASLPEAAKEFVNLMGDATVFAFKGEMGAGKTTFINELARQLGVTEDFTSSPSFALINEYRSDTTAELIYHFDLYRLESLEDAFEIGVEDYFDSGALCLIEWPDLIADILPKDTVWINVKVNPDSTRTLTLSLPE